MNQRPSQWDGVWRGLTEAVGLDRLFGDASPDCAHDGLGRLLLTDPQPLILPHKKMIVVFSPKSACTSVVVWFFNQLGHAKAARDYSHWPHRYRTQVYYRSRLYRRSFELDLPAFSLVRVIRDPFERAVSSFRAVQRGGLADKQISRMLRRRDIGTAGLSFSEFLDFLERCDLLTCDPHYRIQKHPIEDRLPTSYLINASQEDLFARLNEIEADFDLPVTDFTKLEWLQEISRKHFHVEDPIHVGDVYTHRFTREDARRRVWPAYSAFLTPAARDRLARLYAADLAAYGALSATADNPNQPMLANHG